MAFEYATESVTVDGIEFVLREPDLTRAVKLTDIMLTLMGNPQEALMKLADSESLTGDEVLAFVIRIFVGAFTSPLKHRTEIAELFATLTEDDAQDGAYFLEPDLLSLPGALRLVRTAVPLIPFDSCLQEVKAVIEMFSMESEGSEEKPASDSQSDAAGDPTTSDDSASDSPSDSVED